MDGNLVKFRNAKAKELLALCVDHRGGEVTMEEAIDKLWEDRDCDYYDLLDDRQEAMQKFDDAYMTEYSWAEETLGSLFDYLDRWGE